MAFLGHTVHAPAAASQIPGPTFSNTGAEDASREEVVSHRGLSSSSRTAGASSSSEGGWPKVQRKFPAHGPKTQGAWVSGWRPQVGSPGDSHGWVRLAVGVASWFQVRGVLADINGVRQPGAVLHSPQTHTQRSGKLAGNWPMEDQDLWSPPRAGPATVTSPIFPVTIQPPSPGQAPPSFPGNGMKGHGMQAGSR